MNFGKGLKRWFLRDIVVKMVRKRLEEMADDVKEGDLVRIFLEHSDYVGYRWDVDKSKLDGQLMLDFDADILFSGLNPYGYTRLEKDSIVIYDGPVMKTESGPIMTKKLQFVGVNLSTGMLGNEHITRYEILERTQIEEEQKRQEEITAQCCRITGMVSSSSLTDFSGE